MKQLTTTGVFGQSCQEIAKGLLNQPELLDGVFFDDNPTKTGSHDKTESLVLTVKQYTGERSTQDEQRMLMVGALRLLGATDREIERACNVTRRTIPVLMRELEQTGRVTPLKDRLIQIVGNNAEQTSILLRQLIDKGLGGEVSIELAAMIKSVGSVNTFQLEKHQLLTGAATEIIEHREGVGREEAERWWKETAVPVASETTASEPPVESQSTVTHEKANEIGPPHPHDTAFAPNPAPFEAAKTGTPENGGGGDARAATCESPTG